jgi:uncharacterized protein (DUF983 family)
MAIWAINYGIIASVGAGAYFVLDFFMNWSLRQILLWVMPLAGLLGFLLIRHSKAWFIALDQWCDPSPIKKQDAEKCAPRGKKC